MKKYLLILFLPLFIISCSDSNSSIENLTIAQHIELIKNHSGKIEITFEELPEVSQNYISTLENNIITELILHADDLGYEIKIKRESRSLISILNVLYIYFDQNGELLFDEDYDLDNDGDYDMFDEWEDIMCFDIQFPISATMPDGSQLSIVNEDELYESIEEYYEMGDEQDGLPEINFPINIIFYYEVENGTEIQEIVGVENYEELEMYFEMCQDEGEGGGEDNENWFGIDCVDLVYPISIENPEGEILSVDSEYALNEYIDQYYENCNSDNCGDFTLIFPLTIEYYSENNEQTQNLTINSEEELEEYLDEYCYNDDVCPEIYEPVCGSDGVTYSNYCYAESAGVFDYSTEACDDDSEGDDSELETCGEIIYPVTVEASNGDQFTGESEEEIYEFMAAWHSNNCNTMECNEEFEIVYPITMEFQDNQGEVIVMTIQSEEMLEEISYQYCGD